MAVTKKGISNPAGYYRGRCGCHLGPTYLRRGRVALVVPRSVCNDLRYALDARRRKSDPATWSDQPILWLTPHGASRAKAVQNCSFKRWREPRLCCRFIGDDWHHGQHGKGLEAPRPARWRTGRGAAGLDNAEKPDVIRLTGVGARSCFVKKLARHEPGAGNSVAGGDDFKPCAPGWHAGGRKWSFRI